MPLLGYEPKRADFEYVALNANELLLPEKRAEAEKLFQKGNLENKRVILTLSGADVRAQSFGIDS